MRMCAVGTLKFNRSNFFLLCMWDDAQPLCIILINMFLYRRVFVRVSFFSAHYFATQNGFNVREWKIYRN